MSVVLFVLLVAVILAAAGLMVVMFLRDKPLYGVVGLGLLAGPGSLLAVLHLSLA
ncbi:hypothetical protein Q5530_07505 [Saccharothrix sp. BKS2]|uniref:Uncharacterized protein n=1 Tax=Saccharothrix lopnurensis TaxID=1670621 RepID=A0ABW1PEM7_9PSEU